MASIRQATSIQMLLLVALCFCAVSYHGAHGRIFLRHTSLQGNNEAAPLDIGKGGNDLDDETRGRSGQIALPDKMTSEDIMSVLCDQMQSVLPECRTVPTLQERFGTGESSNGRKKRDVWNPFPSFLQDQNFGYERLYSARGGDNTYVCPTQTNYSVSCQYSSDSDNYPTKDIAAELNNDQLLAMCLAKELILPNALPRLPEDSFLPDSNASCPFEEKILWSFQSQTRTSRCWVLTNFQEVIKYKQCMTEYPKNCKQKASQGTSYNSAESWDSWDPWGDSPHGPSTAANRTTPINRCITEHNVVSLWAYCSVLPLGSRIVRERIVIPTGCTPYSVPCQAVNTRW